MYGILFNYFNLNGIENLIQLCKYIKVYLNV